MATVKEQMLKAQDLIKAKRYDEARKILVKIDHPKAQEWLAKIDNREPVSSVRPAGAKPKREAQPVKAKVGTQRFLRNLWGIITLLSCGWIAFGLIATSSAVNQVMSTPVPGDETMQAAAVVGTGLGAGLGITFFVCTGLPFFLFAAILYWRNGVAIRQAQQHTEMVNATRGV
jgi:hypothetical protein